MSNSQQGAVCYSKVLSRSRSAAVCPCVLLLGISCTLQSDQRGVLTFWQGIMGQSEPFREACEDIYHYSTLHLFVQQPLFSGLSHTFHLGHHLVLCFVTSFFSHKGVVKIKKMKNPCGLQNNSVHMLCSKYNAVFRIF